MEQKQLGNIRKETNKKKEKKKRQNKYNNY